MPDNLNTQNNNNIKDMSKVYFQAMQAANVANGGNGNISVDDIMATESIFNTPEAANIFREAITQYADAEGILTEDKFAAFNNDVAEMVHIEDRHIVDGQLTKGEVKTDLINQLDGSVDTAQIEKLIDKYVGDDGIFDVAEYTKLKNDPEFKAILEKHNIQLGTGEYRRKNEQTQNPGSFNYQSAFTNFNFGNFNFVNMFSGFNFASFISSFMSIFKF
ncbi:hypothetical protein IKE67_05705 [bacterium]|nr:hypothetical protein [bacterium]